MTRLTRTVLLGYQLNVAPFEAALPDIGYAAEDGPLTALCAFDGEEAVVLPLDAEGATSVIVKLLAQAPLSDEQRRQVQSALNGGIVVAPAGTLRHIR